MLLVGIDGASPRLVEPLLLAGRLPTLAALARDGVRGRLRVELPLISPRIWNTIATGKTPEQHGILSFARDEGGDRTLYLSHDRRAHALWNIASDAGLSVGVVNWWNTFPPDVVNGIVISDHALPRRGAELAELTGAAAAPAGPLVHPAEWGPRALELLRDPLPVAPADDPFLGRLALPRWTRPGALSSRAAHDAALAKLALDIERNLRPDLLMVMLPGVDRVSHVLWGAIDPSELHPASLRFDPVEREAARAALEGYYELVDGLVGELVARYRSDDLVVVVSDHGFEAGVALGRLTGVHRSEAARHGVLFARGPGVPAGAVATDLAARDVTPTILAWLGLPVGDDMAGRPAGFLDVDGVARVPTHDASPVERLDATASGRESELLEQLRDLGYLE